MACLAVPERGRVRVRDSAEDDPAARSHGLERDPHRVVVPGQLERDVRTVTRDVLPWRDRLIRAPLNRRLAPMRQR
jgi:hypothetical protein